MLTYSSWIEKKISLCSELSNGACGGSYAEGAIILCVAIASMSSLMWVEQDRTDRKRFIEIVAKSSDRGFDATTVSGPLLAQTYTSLKSSLGISDKAFVYSGDHDKTEDDVTKMYSASENVSLDKSKLEVRKYSYATLLYEQVRCGFIHTYGPRDSAAEHDTLWEMFHKKCPKVTYVNYLASEGGRKIFFPTEWISEVARNVAANMDRVCSRNGTYIGVNLNLPVPNQWWIDGG